ncbi:sugar ABC transporter substrate-binding protein [Paenibacillus sp. PL91]|uniref:sugar ABC transporter substrate-binding protein n=1 Tax=Paenibacillus sp. PL91 TaxID=2729538 RepID=UPI00145F8B4E|nr:sugar ABC transporter substrate-binding protein [Paenibacillus sp. PL91]MBC9204909.1 sugar ABC transporter substrate-binding protein [Paenibacillus sp. PL91]
MSRKRSIFFTLLCLTAMAILISACSSGNSNSGSSAPSEKSETKSPGNSDNNYRIGLVMKTLSNPFFITMEKGARKAEAEFGIKLDAQAGQEETSIEQQIAIIEDMISKKMDAIVVAPGGSKEIVPVLKKAQEAGVMLINIDNRIDKAAADKAGLNPIPYVGASNMDGGYLAGKYLAEKLGGKGKVAIIEGIQGVDNAEQRKAGALKAFKEFSGIEVVASQSANWKTEEGLNVMANILQSNPELTGVFCANDMMALGAVQAIESAGKTGIVLVAAYDALEEAKQYIKDGKMISTIDQKPDDVGYYGVKFAIDALNGKEVPAEHMVDLVNITKDIVN